MVDKILFLSNNREDSRAAAHLFREQASKSNLAWESAAGTIDDAEQLSSSAAMIVIVEPTSASNKIPSLSVPTEVWKYSAPEDFSGTIGKNLANLIVRLILKGGKRQPSAESASALTPAPTQLLKARAQTAVRVGLESKGRGGKKVSVITGLPLSDNEFEDLTTKLKRSCGTGGTYKDQQIEIQGDHRAKLMTELEKLGYKPKRTGG
ncbi:MAG TPA: hypothetical protein V6C89_09305 [Drouetiella sp.]|jgi:translation initiation factor 1